MKPRRSSHRRIRRQAPAGRGSHCPGQHRHAKWRARLGTGCRSVTWREETGCERPYAGGRLKERCAPHEHVPFVVAVIGHGDDAARVARHDPSSAATMVSSNDMTAMGPRVRAGSATRRASAGRRRVGSLISTSTGTRPPTGRERRKGRYASSVARVTLVVRLRSGSSRGPRQPFEGEIVEDDGLAVGRPRTSHRCKPASMAARGAAVAVFSTTPAALSCRLRCATGRAV